MKLIQAAVRVIRIDSILPDCYAGDMYKKLIHYLIGLALLILGGAGYWILKTGDTQTAVPEPKVESIPKTSLTLSSPAFESREAIPSEYTCDGANISPPLTITGVPVGTQSLVLVMEDPNTPTKAWLHWLVYTLEPENTELKKGEVPITARQGINDFGKAEYGGPCPPSGQHHYSFKLYALDIPFDFPEGLRLEAVMLRIQNHIIGQTELVGVYERQLTTNN